MRGLLTALLLLTSLGASAEEYKLGEVVDGLTADADPAVTYSYYLPRRYTPDQRWPILYVFDPRQRGSLGAELFRDAAEQYGWIVISSNNTRSDSDAAPTIHAVEVMLPDAQRRFSVDTRRIYLAGFSGTAVVAWAIADVTKSVAGLIGCSGRPIDTKGNYRVPFGWFGTAGESDFNYLETLEIDRGLAAANGNHRLEIFDGPHRWPPSNLLRQAIEWMELQAMKAGTRPRDDELVKRLLSNDIFVAREESDPLAAVRRYETVVRTYDGLAPVDEARKRAAELRASRAYANAAQQQQHAEELELSYRQSAARAMSAFKRAGEAPLAASLAHDLDIATLQRMAGKRSYDGLAAQRVLEGIYVQVSFYVAREVTGRKLAVLKTVARMIHPDQ